MLRFKRFVSEMNMYEYGDFLAEELNDEQKEKVNHWQRGKAEEISSHVIPHGQDRISIPFEHNDEKPIPHPAVLQHLHNHGYDVHDYKEGTATKAGDKRIFKIGKVLNSTKADKDTVNAFQNDPARSGNKAKYHIVISRHPHDVAGMSTNQGWTSCMNMEKGCNKHYLQHDVERGTHVAYLAHADDHAAKKPVARIALKPFQPEDKTKKTILRPEPRVYGTASPEFEKQVNKWSKENFPLEKTHYKKDAKLYHDGGERAIINRDLAGQSTDPNIRKKVYDHRIKLEPDMITHGLNDPSEKVRAYVASHPSATTEHIEKALNDPHHSVRKAALENNENLTADHITKALNDPHASVREEAAKSNKITPEHVDKILNDKNAKVRTAAFFHRLTDDRNDVTDHIQPRHIIKAANDKSEEVRRMAIQHENAPTDVVDKALNDPSHFVRYAAARHPNLSPELLHKGLADLANKDPDQLHGIGHGLASNPNINKEHIDKVVNDDNLDAANHLLDNHGNKSNRKFDNNNIQKLYNAAVAPNTSDSNQPTPEEINNSYDLSHAKNTKAEVLKKITQHHGEKLSREQWEELANHPSHRVREEIMNVHHTPIDILEKATKDPVRVVARSAQRILEYLKRNNNGAHVPYNS